MRPYLRFRLKPGDRAVIVKLVGLKEAWLMDDGKADLALLKNVIYLFIYVLAAWPLSTVGALRFCST